MRTLINYKTTRQLNATKSNKRIVAVIKLHKWFAACSSTQVQLALPFKKINFSSNLSDNFRRRSKNVCPAKLHNCSTGADEGKAVFYLKNIFLRWDNHSKIKLRLDYHLSNAAFPTHYDIENRQ